MLQNVAGIGEAKPRNPSRPQAPARKPATGCPGNCQAAGTPTSRYAVKPTSA